MSSAAELGKQVLEEVKTSLGDDYDSLTKEQTDSIEETATMLMAKQIELATTDDATKKQELTAQIEALESIVQDWKVWGVLGVEDAFWKGVSKVAATIGTFLASFATEALSRIVPGL